jgi:hypothetical protein
VSLFTCHLVFVPAIEHETEHRHNHHGAVRAALGTAGDVEHTRQRERNHRQKHGPGHLVGVLPPHAPEGISLEVVLAMVTSSAMTSPPNGGHSLSTWLPIAPVCLRRMST